MSSCQPNCGKRLCIHGIPCECVCALVSSEIPCNTKIIKKKVEQNGMDGYEAGQKDIMMEKKSSSNTLVFHNIDLEFITFLQYEFLP